MIRSEIESLNFKQYKMSDCQKSQRVPGDVRSLICQKSEGGWGDGAHSQHLIEEQTTLIKLRGSLNL